MSIEREREKERRICTEFHGHMHGPLKSQYFNRGPCTITGIDADWDWKGIRKKKVAAHTHAHSVELTFFVSYTTLILLPLQPLRLLLMQARRPNGRYKDSCQGKAVWELFFNLCATLSWLVNQGMLVLNILFPSPLQSTSCLKHTQWRRRDKIGNNFIIFFRVHIS